MWIITEHGFFTFVTDRKDPNYVWLRARVREDLERNFPDVEVTEKPGADYLYRAKVLRTVVAERMAQMVMDSNITSHFKDVALSKAPAEGKADRRSAYYGLWSALAKLQPYAPYSRVPRTQEKTWWKPGQKATVGEGQRTLEPFSYGGAGNGRYASDFDWDSRDWGGTSTADPVVGTARLDDFVISDEEWQRMTPEEQASFLDAEEQALRSVEIGEDFGAAARMAEFRQAGESAFPAPRNRPGRRRGRKAKRKNRHNQDGLDRGQEAVNRQTYLDKKAARRNGTA